jgi:hypothetical protein
MQHERKTSAMPTTKKQKKTPKASKLVPVNVVGVPFYDEHDAVIEAATSARMKKGPFIREIVRKYLGLPSQLDAAK